MLRCACGSTMSGWTRRPDRSHGERSHYICYERRVGGGCKSKSVPQDTLETDVAGILGAVALPAGFAQAVDMASRQDRAQTRGRVATLKSIDAGKARVRDMYELGDIARDEYLRRRESLEGEVMDLKAAERQTFRTQRSALRSLVDDWHDMAQTRGSGCWRRSSRR